MTSVRGLAALNAAMSKLPKDVATKVGQMANRAGATVLAKEVRKIAPNSTKTTEGEKRTRRNKGGSTREETHGKIVNNVIVKKTKSTSPTQVHNAVGVRSNAYHASYVEFGSIHNSADPFMLKALQNANETIIETIARALNKQLVKRGV